MDWTVSPDTLISRSTCLSPSSWALTATGASRAPATSSTTAFDLVMMTSSLTDHLDRSGPAASSARAWHRPALEGGGGRRFYPPSRPDGPADGAAAGRRLDCRRLKPG